MGLVARKPKQQVLRAPPVLTDVVLREFSGLWNQADNELNLKSNYFPTLLNWERKENGALGPRYGYKLYSSILNRPTLKGTLKLIPGDNQPELVSENHGLVEGTIIRLSGFPSTPSSYLGISTTDLSKPLTVIGPVTSDSMFALLPRWTTATGEAVDVEVDIKADLPTGNIIDLISFQNRLIWVTDTGYIGALDDLGHSRTIWGPSIVELISLDQDLSPTVFLYVKEGFTFLEIDTGQALYNITDALHAADVNDAHYFDVTIPSHKTTEPPFEGFTDIPPRTRGDWKSKPALAGLSSVDHGKRAIDVITRPRFPLVREPDAFIDPKRRVRIDASPDGEQGTIRVRHDNDYQNEDAYFRLDSFPNGVNHLALSAKLRWQGDYDFMDPATDDIEGTWGFGLWLGKHGNEAYWDRPPEKQDGVWITVTWDNQDVISTEPGGSGVLYSFHLNRKEDRDGSSMHGTPLGRMPIELDTWINFDLEVKLNKPGLADGIIRLWIKDILVGEITNAVLSLDDSWKLRGYLFYDGYGQVGFDVDDYIVPPQDQSYYINGITYWTPPEDLNTSEVVVPKIGSLIQLSGWPTMGGVPEWEINRVHKIEDIVGDRYKVRILTPAVTTVQSALNLGIARVSLSRSWRETAFASHAVSNRQLLIGNGIDKPVKVDFLDVNSARFLTDPASDSNINTPVARYVAAGSEYTVWGGNALEPGVIYISAAGTNGTYEGDQAPNDAIHMDVATHSSSTNGEITGLSFHKGLLWVGFDNDFVIIELGQYTEEVHTPTVKDVIKNFGCIAHKAMVSVGEVFYSVDVAGVVNVEESMVSKSFKPQYVSELIASHISGSMSKISALDQRDKVWAFYDKRMSRYMLWVPRGDGVFHTYVYTLLPDKKVGGWQLFRAYDFTCGVRSELSRLFVAKGPQVFYLGNSTDEIYNDNGTDVEGVFETPWMDLKSRNDIKRLRYLNFDTDGNGTFKVSLFTDRYYEDLQQLQTDHEHNPDIVYDEFTLPLIPTAEQFYVGADRGGYGGDKQTYGGGMRTARNALLAMSLMFKQLKLRVWFRNNKKMDFTSIILSYQRGSIRG